MREHQHIPQTIFRTNPLGKIIDFDKIISIPSTNLLISSSSTSLSFPLIVEKPGVRFKIFILLLTLFISLIIGFILSLIFVTQFIHVIPKHTFLSHELFSILPKQNIIHNKYLFDSIWIDQLDFNNTNICENFYSFVCQKWLINHPLSPLEFKRSWLTEKSQDIRENFAKILANISYNHQIEIEQATIETEIDDYDGLTSAKNELEQFYSSHNEYDNDNYKHKLIKRELNINKNNLSRSISNMLIYYQQCLNTSQILLLKQLNQLAYDHFWFTNNYEIHSTINHLDYFFEQMIEHPLMRIWNINTINLGTQIIIHIQRQIQNQEKNVLLYQIQQANLFEYYVKKNHINLCYQSSRVGSLSNTLKQYNDLLISSLILSNSSVNDDLNNLITNQNSLPIIYSSIKYSNELKNFIQFILDKNLIQSLNNTNIYYLFSNFTYDLEINLIHIPIFRSTISSQCQLYLKYYIHFRSLNETKFQHWYDYISTSIINIIIHSWPGDASYTCLYSTIIRHKQFQIIPYWNRFIYYIKKQIKDISIPIITMDIRLVDFFQLDSIFRFLFADQYAHYCNLMVYKYGPKLLPFVSVFDEDIQISLKSLWKQILQENSREQSNIPSLPLPSHRIPNDCLTLLEYYYPFTLSSFYEEYMLNKTTELYSVVYKLRDILINNFNEKFLSSLQINIKSERLKLFEDLSSISTYIPYEYYLIENNYLSTAWNIIESSHDELIEPIHEFFEINAYHTIEQGIVLQPTIAELYSNKTTQLIALLIIAHELGHALCPCGINLTEREYFADLISLNLIFNYNKQELNQTNQFQNFFLTYVQSECIHINHEMMLLMNKQENFIDLHINRVLNNNEQFQTIFNCSLNQQQQQIKLPELCAACRKKENIED